MNVNLDMSLQESELQDLNMQIELKAKELQSQEALLQTKVSHFVHTAHWNPRFKSDLEHFYMWFYIGSDCLSCSCHDSSDTGRCTWNEMCRCDVTFQFSFICIQLRLRFNSRKESVIQDFILSLIQA